MYSGRLMHINNVAPPLEPLYFLPSQVYMDRGFIWTADTSCYYYHYYY